MDLDLPEDKVKVQEEIATVVQPETVAPRVASRLNKSPMKAEVAIPKTVAARRLKPKILEEAAPEESAELIEQRVKVEKASSEVQQRSPLKTHEMKRNSVGGKRASVDIGAVNKLTTEQEKKKYETETAKNPQHIAEANHDEEQ